MSCASARHIEPTSHGPAISDADIGCAMVGSFWVDAPPSVSRHYREMKYMVVGSVEQVAFGDLATGWFGSHRFGGYRDPDLARMAVDRAFARAGEIIRGEPRSSTVPDGRAVPFAAGVLASAALFSILVALSFVPIPRQDPRLTECLTALQSQPYDGQQHGGPKHQNRILVAPSD